MTPRIDVSETILESIRTALDEKLGIPSDEVHLESRLKEDLGLDSLDLVELLTAVEEQIGSPLNDDLVPHLTTVAKVVELIAERTAALPPVSVE
ncbi:acyl carrier protein [Streptomyces sp. NPDC058548]|uniref:acyl carrier protein n=1 Tax=unclassified Streptomyces TaxID=2593676 RepID=UPI0036571C1C